MKPVLAAKRIRVKGVVQGVGFRPYIYQLAESHALAGRVANTAAGVLVHVEGPADQVAAFCAAIGAQAPPLAQITAVEADDVRPEHLTAFTIAPSHAGQAKTTLISPDVSICADCRTELHDPDDRRCGYPFINCTNCGPRYTIIEDLPYDRPKTSMRCFTMCPACQAEYDDPRNRRFHAQPNACPVCGPHIALHDARGKRLAADDVLVEAARRLAAGEILAIKGLGGFHLAVDATREDAVQRLRRRKHREEKPLALMARNAKTIEAFARPTPEDIAVLTSPQRPIVLLPKRHPNPIAPSVAPRNAWFGVMLPYTPLHDLLLAQGFTALVMTSGNLSEEPIAIENADALKRLGDIADAFILHNRDIYLRCDDSIVRKTTGVTRFLRRSRGYVPVPVFLKAAQPAVLACGAELKNTVCLTKEDRAFVSQHIGDLENLATYDFFQQTIDHLARVLDIHPELTACDLHPDYLSTRYARQRTDLPCIAVQHHHAHIVSCMAEHHLEGRVIGLACDGTGYGTDGTVWGGEVLLAEAAGFQRVAHLAPVPMPGSAAAIKAPWRMAVSYLAQAFGQAFWDLDIPLLKTIDHRKIAVMVEMAAKGVNAPHTSSLGRLFDGVAAIIGLRQEVAFEGQAAMELEMIAGEADGSHYDVDWETRQGIRVISIAPIITGIVDDLGRGFPPARLSRRFHTTLVVLFTRLCQALRDETGLTRVVLSGGSFQNVILTSELTEALEQAGLSVFSHRLVPPNDGGLSLGQAVAAAAMTRTAA
jgi:hydrogenase maturation protein HypF